MSPTDRPRELLRLAERDFQAAWILAHAENPQTDAAGFHLQQAAEKSLKVWLALDGVDYPRTHDLNPLFDEAIGHYQIVSEHLKKVAETFPFKKRKDNYIKDENRRRTAIESLKTARQAEEAGLKNLRRIADRL